MDLILICSEALKSSFTAIIAADGCFVSHVSTSASDGRFKSYASTSASDGRFMSHFSTSAAHGRFKSHFSTSASYGRFMSHVSTYLQLVSYVQQKFGAVSSDDEVDIRMACADEMQDVRSLPEHQAAHDHKPDPTRDFLRWIF